MAVPDSDTNESWHIFKKYWVPVTLYAGFIFYMSSLSVPISNVQIDLSVLHVPMFFVLSYLSMRALVESSKKIGIGKAMIAAIVFTAMYGILDELHQLYVPGRTFSYFDMELDALGGLLIVFKEWWEKLFEKVNL